LPLLTPEYASAEQVQALPLDPTPYQALRRHVERCEALQEFRSTYTPFAAPDPG